MLKKAPKSRFDSSSYDSPNGLDAFRQMTESVYDVYPLDDESAFYVNTFGYQVGDLMFTNFKCKNTRFRRTEQHLQSENNDFLVLHAQLSGEELIQMEHGVVRLMSGNIYLRDWSYTFSSQVIDMDIYGILIPRKLITFSSLFNVHNPIISWSMSEAEGAMIWAIWSKIFHDLNDIDLVTAETLCKGFLGLLNGLFTVQNKINSDKNSNLHTIESFVRAQLRGDINTETLCSQFNISRATLYRIFKEHGGLNHYIDKLRLKRCYQELSETDARQTTIAEIASGWGYYDASVFNRKFRKEFGLPPSKVLGIHYNEENAFQKNSKSEKGLQKPYVAFKKWLENASSLNL